MIQYSHGQTEHTPDERPMLNIAIIGTRGIPNQYGGFEQFAEHLSVGLVKRGHRVTVYSPHFHPYPHDSFHGVDIRRIFCPERFLGSAANFIYDHLALRDALQGNFDILYEAGYQSSALSFVLCRVKNRREVLITNMDGMEWQRAKWNRLVKWLTRRFETMAVKRSDHLVVDNPGIRDYYLERHGARGVYIPYGADPAPEIDDDVLKDLALKPRSYFLLIARLEPENNIETIIAGVRSSASPFPLVVVGPRGTRHARRLSARFPDPRIRFVGGIYDKARLDALRHHAAVYFHGHSVGGTNPSLLEAMAARALIAAHDNPFNRHVLGDDALYFRNQNDIRRLLEGSTPGSTRRKTMIENNHRRIRSEYAWSRIVDAYESLFQKVGVR